MQNLILQNAIWYVFCDIIIDNKLYVIMDIFVYFLKSASNLNGNLNCSKELEHYAS